MPVPAPRKVNSFDGSRVQAHGYWSHILEAADFSPPYFKIDFDFDISGFNLSLCGNLGELKPFTGDDKATIVDKTNIQIALNGTPDDMKIGDTVTIFAWSSQ